MRFGKCPWQFSAYEGSVPDSSFGNAMHPSLTNGSYGFVRPEGAVGKAMLSGS